MKLHIQEHLEVDLTYLDQVVFQINILIKRVFN